MDIFINCYHVKDGKKFNLLKHFALEYEKLTISSKPKKEDDVNFNIYDRRQLALDKKIFLLGDSLKIIAGYLNSSGGPIDKSLKINIKIDSIIYDIAGLRISIAGTPIDRVLTGAYDNIPLKLWNVNSIKDVIIAICKKHNIEWKGLATTTENSLIDKIMTNQKIVQNSVTNLGFLVKLAELSGYKIMTIDGKMQFVIDVQKPVGAGILLNGHRFETLKIIDSAVGGFVGQKKYFFFDETMRVLAKETGETWSDTTGTMNKKKRLEKKRRIVNNYSSLNPRYSPAVIYNLLDLKGNASANMALGKVKIKFSIKNDTMNPWLTKTRIVTIKDIGYLSGNYMIKDVTHVFQSNCWIVSGMMKALIDA